MATSWVEGDVLCMGLLYAETAQQPCSRLVVAVCRHQVVLAASDDFFVQFNPIAIAISDPRMFAT